MLIILYAKHICSAHYSFWFIQVSVTLIRFQDFFVDINLFKANKEKVAEISKNSVNENGSSSTEKDDFADDLILKKEILISCFA